MARKAPQGRLVEVLLPAAERIHRPPDLPLATRIRTLDGARVGFVDNTFLAVRVMHDEIGRALAAAGIRRMDVTKKYWRPLSTEQIDHLSRASDAVVGSLANTSPSAVCSTRDAVALEARGIPTVTFVTAYFEDLLTETAAAEGMPALRRIVLPSGIEGAPEATVRALGAAAVEHVVAALTRSDGAAVVRL